MPSLATRCRRARRGAAALAVVAPLAFTATASPAATVQTIGQLAASPVSCGTGLNDRLPLGNAFQYTVPGGPGLNSWTVISWSHNAPASGASLTMTMKMYRGDPSSGFWQVVGLDGPRQLVGGQLNTFSVSIPVMTGDVVGLSTSGQNGCKDAEVMFTHLVHPGFLAVGQGTHFTSTEPGRLNVTAQIVPTNTFTLRRAKIHAKKGTATVFVDVPNVGELTASGKGVKAASGRATISKTINFAGTAKLPIKAQGKKKRKLDRRGKVALNPRITYIPAQGDPSIQSTSLTLKKRRP